MDHRIADLLDDYPDVFEKRKPRLDNIEDRWVIIDVPGGVDGTDPSLGWSDDSFLNDLDRFDESPPDLLRDLGTSYPLDLALPEPLDIGPAVVGELIGRKRPEALADLRRRIRGRFPGSPGGVGSDGLVPPPDALAVYLPFHIYPDMWGIYLLDAGVASLAHDVGLIARARGHEILPLHARRIAIAYLFHHEAYHCAVESFAVRSELAMRKPLYRRGLRKLYLRDWSPDSPHEETLATAYGLRKVQDEICLPREDLDAGLDALMVYMRLCSPVYATGVAYLDDAGFDRLEREFIEESIRLSSGKALPSRAWTIATYVMTPLLQRNRKYSWICRRTDFKARSRLAVHYFRRRDVISCLEKVASARVEPGSRHLHLVREVEQDGRRTQHRTQVPSGEVHRGTLSGMLRDLGLDINVHEFRDRCRQARRALS